MAKIRIPSSKKSTVLPSWKEFLQSDTFKKLLEAVATKTDSVIRDENIEVTESLSEVTGVSKLAIKEYANGWLVLLAYTLVAMGVIVGSIVSIWAPIIAFTPLQDSTGTIGFLALFFIMAQAIERLMEPVAEINWGNVGSAKKIKELERDKKIKLAQKSLDDKTREIYADDAADLQAQANQIAANTKVFIWGFASFVAMLISGITGIYFLDAIGFSGVPTYLNIMITGLVIGGGTKPLHELIKLIEKKSSTPSSEEEGEG